MTTKFVMSGEVIDHTAQATVSSGQVLLIGSRIGVALSACAAGQVVAVRVLGIFTIAKLSTDAVAQGAALYWDNTNSRLTTTASGNTLAGFASAAAGAGVGTVEISINA